eukprot:Gregarina_sp_Pseudo_9__5023@NODE_527_length_2643_cov_958_654378_g498_i0_p2_GENE_NODE_527_length_2643_cov_958_654378_g498_i0NODE_527_length_2643_cov_958_654378_g498_i0_p2_ORF_typecomplete_len330_score28_75_NODE_527_length_2643_cov_958_654378_g498_i01131102
MKVAWHDVSDGPLYGDAVEPVYDSPSYGEAMSPYYDEGPLVYDEDGWVKRSEKFKPSVDPKAANFVATTLSDFEDSADSADSESVETSPAQKHGKEWCITIKSKSKGGKVRRSRGSRKYYRWKDLEVSLLRKSVRQFWNERARSQTQQLLSRKYSKRTCFNLPDSSIPIPQHLHAVLRFQRSAAQPDTICVIKRVFSLFTPHPVQMLQVETAPAQTEDLWVSEDLWDTAMDKVLKSSEHLPAVPCCECVPFALLYTTESLVANGNFVFGLRELRITYQSGRLPSVESTSSSTFMLLRSQHANASACSRFQELWTEQRLNIVCVLFANED